MREYGQTRKITSQRDIESSELSSSDEEATELTLNEHGQILLTKDEMAAWVKQVSNGYNIYLSSLIIPGISSNTRKGTTRKLQPFPAC